MALKAKQFFTASAYGKGVVVWDTTLKPMCVKLKEYDPEALGYDSLTRKMSEEGKVEFTTKSGVTYIIQRHFR